MKEFEIGKTCLESGDFDSAIRQFTEVIRLVPQAPTGYVYRGHACGRKGEFEKAIADFTEAIRINPKDAYAYHSRGYAYDRIGSLGKALTAGYLPMSVAIANDKVFDTFRSDAKQDRTFYDGHTYCGNPITSAAALAAIDIFTSDDIVNQAKPAAEFLKQSFENISEYSSVDYQQTLGTIAMCSFTEEAGGEAFARRVSEYAMEMVLFVRPLGEVLYLWPPLVVSHEELSQMVELFNAAITKAEND